MTILVRILSVLGLIGYTGFVFLIVAMSGMSPSATDPWTGPTLLRLALPVVYLLFCLVSSVRVFAGLALLICGVIAHAVILPFVFLSLRTGEMNLFNVAGLIMAAAWFGMYLERERKRKRPPCDSP